MIEIEQLWEMIDRNVTLQVSSEGPCELEARAPFLAEDIHATMDFPAFDHSAMDGYAFADWAPGWHTITSRIAAGETPQQLLHPGQVARVLTGAPVPEGVLFIARQEDCETHEGQVRLNHGVCANPGDHIRRRGAVWKVGDKILPRGQRLHAGHLALLAAMGIGDIPRLPELSAWHLVTGDELRQPGQPLSPGKIYDSNGPMIRALLESHHVKSQTNHVGDENGALRDAIRDFTGHLLLISGGSGPGDRDHTQRALEDAGFTIHASRLNSRPGKPLIFATRCSQVAFGLPGNPLAHWVCFHAFVARAIARLYDQDPEPLMPVKLRQPILNEGDGRRTWTPARVTWASGRLEAIPLKWAHSGDLRALVEANALLLDGRLALFTTPYL